MNLLQIVQQACDEMGLERPVGVIGNQFAEVRQLLALLSRLGQDLVRYSDWQRLIREQIVQTVSVQRMATADNGSLELTLANPTGIQVGFGVAGPGIRPFSQIVALNGTVATLNMSTDKAVNGQLTFAKISYPLPEDWKKQIPQTEWDRTNRWPLLGPQTSQSWQGFKSGIVYNGPRMRFRIQGNAIVLNPPPASNIILAYEYVSKSYVIDEDGQQKPAFTADTDTTIFDPSLLVQGLIIKFKRAKGLDVAFELGEFAEQMAITMGQDKSAPALSLAPRRPDILLSNRNIPDGNWNV